MRSFLSRGYLWRGKTALKTLKLCKFYLKDTRKHDFIYSTMVRFEYMHKTGHHYGTLAHTKNTFQQFLLHTRYSNCKNRVPWCYLVKKENSTISPWSMTERIWQYHGTLSEVSPVKISTCYSLIKSRKHAEVHSLVGEGSADTLLLLLLDLLLLMVWTCSRTRCCEDISTRSDGSARDVSSTSPMDRADLKGSSIIRAFVSTAETGEVQIVNLQRSAFDSGFDSQRDWPGPALLHAHVTPSAPYYIE